MPLQNICMCAGVCVRSVLCYAFLRRETWQRGRERGEMWGFTRKAATDSYIDYDCLIAVSVLRLLMVKEQWRKIIRSHPLCCYGEVWLGLVPVTGRDSSYGFMDSGVSCRINTCSCKIGPAWKWHGLVWEAWQNGIYNIVDVGHRFMKAPRGNQRMANLILVVYGAPDCWHCGLFLEPLIQMLERRG